MASFLENLWSSAFTPGTSPTLLVATNVTFAVLQALLIALLIATYSIHFAILSVLSGGLWYGINWFATELQAAQAKEEEAERLRKVRQNSKGSWQEKGEVGDSADDEGEGEETETEVDRKPEGRKLGHRRMISKEETPVRGSSLANQRAVVEQALGTGAGLGSGMQAQATTGLSRQRRFEESDTSGTESEWEKVEGER
ncbi:Pkr1-domain-containing protein [Teratosphaeria nubilosa]|uniref:Pkr1-domain-containing protein n=1 Tax=Teratosphaeria nubilosa TaxID=161662 RepID=A0A6G1L839_9PEZI|nr:Pkr1-domain-containing protein [Teratosphaeria nubilosa]